MPTSKKRKRPNKRAAPKKQAKTQQTPENHDIHAGVSEGSLGQQTQHPVTLGDLKRTMDPLIAAQVCNACHSPMGRLPEEIVLEILHYLRHVIVGLHCLRQVSARFRRLIYSKDIWRYLKLPRETSGPCIDPSEFWDYPDDLRERLQSHLQKDMMCNQCILNRDMHIVTRHQNKESSAVLLARAFSEAYRFITEPRTPELRRYCHGCRGHHDLLQFSDSEQQPEKQERQCLSRQGTVKLCEHIRIAWDDIETHIEHWLQRAPGDWQACFDHFKIECHDPSHDTRCTAEALPTWPRASLYSRNDGQVALKLEWAPHSGFGAIRLTADGRAPASDLRAIFARYRRGTAKIMLPAFRPDFLPEMVYFDPFRCSCLHYAGWNDGERTETKTPTGKSEDGTFFQRRPARKSCSHQYNRYWNGGIQKVSMERHWGKRSTDTVCLVTTYRREVAICYLTSPSGSISPLYQWYKAMDPDTYDHPTDRYARPPCKDEDCINYYRYPRRNGSRKE